MLVLQALYQYKSGSHDSRGVRYDGWSWSGTGTGCGSVIVIRAYLVCLLFAFGVEGGSNEQHTVKPGTRTARHSLVQHKHVPDIWECGRCAPKQPVGSSLP